jgi:hypothetical protein
MSTRYEFKTIDAGEQDWDADHNDNAIVLREEPWPISELPDTFDETDLEAQFAAAAHRNSLIWVYTTALVWVLYYSDGSAWATWASTFSTATTSGITVTSTSSPMTLTSSSQPIQHITPGANIVVTLDATNHTFGRQFTIAHQGTANTITVQDSSAVTIVVLSAGQTGIVTRDVSAWRSRTTTRATSPTIGGTAIISTIRSAASTPLDIASPSSYAVLQANNELYLLSGSGGSIRFEVGGSERARIVDGGRVLIGTTSDDGVSRLQVSGTLSVSGDIGFQTGYSSSLPVSTLLFAGASKELTSTVQTGCLTSANLRTMLTDETGTGAAVFAENPTFQATGSNTATAAFTNSSSTSFGASNLQFAAIWTTVDTTTNNWSGVGVSNNGGFAGGWGYQHTDQTNGYCEIAFFTKGPSGFGERFRVKECSVTVPKITATVEGTATFVAGDLWYNTTTDTFKVFLGGGGGIKTLVTI